MKLIKFFASLKMAVIIVLVLAGLAAWGTFVEATYNDSHAAQTIVYHSIWMVGAMALLAICLIAVMVDRWPWKKRHIGFILAHIGILILMLGALITQKLGLDGSIAIGIGQKGNLVSVSPTDFTVYTSIDGQRYAKIFDREVDFFANSPKEHPIRVSVPDGEITAVDAYPYALRDEKVTESASKSDGAGLRFQLQNERVHLADWLMQGAKGREAVRDLGPARIVLRSAEAPAAPVDPSVNQIILEVKDDGSVNYSIHRARTPNEIKKGVAHAGDSIETGWMGLVFRILKVLPHAKSDIGFKPIHAHSDLSTSAVKVRYHDREEWLGLNSIVKFFSDTEVYIVSYGNRRLDLGFPIQLKDFKVGRYQGTARAASYESLVELPGSEIKTPIRISMNEPLKYKGYTFYQASFSEDEKGNPTVSVLSVNQDPGRWLKYLGSLLIVLGALHMFYFKKLTSRGVA